MLATLLNVFLLVLAPLQNFPGAFPREGAKQLIDNPRVTVWEVTLEKGKPTPMHRHQYDMVAVDLADATVQVRQPDGTVQPGVARVGQVISLSKSTTHIEEATSDKPRHAIVIELKDFVVPPVENKSGYPNAFPRDGAKKVLDNNRLVVWDYAWTPGKPTPMHFHDKDVVVVFLANGELKSTGPDGKADVNPISHGLTRFNARSRIHNEELVKGSARAIIFELK